ncbi:MAG: hypothetical protein ABI475_01380 [Methylophilaceae bacterium]
MPLSLKIPALIDKPLLLAERRPQKIAQFINNLPISNPLEAASVLLEEMQILNRQKVTPNIRVKTLEIYRPALTNLVEMLTVQYCNTPLPLPQLAKKYAGAAQSLWLELSYGYKLALVDQQNKLFSLGASKSTSLVLQRAIEAMSQLAMVYYQTYVPAPGSIWGDLHQLYIYAAQQSLQGIEVPTGTGLNQTTTVDVSYKQALLMALADPQHLTPNDIQQVADYIARHARHTQIQGLGLLKNPAGIFLISLDKDKPPIPYIKNIEQTDADNDVLFITVDLARLAHKHLKILQSGTLPGNGNLPENATDPRYQDMLTYLIKHWGASPQRIFNRSRKTNTVELGIGIATAHYFVNGEQTYVAPAQAHDVTEIAACASPAPDFSLQKFKPSRWQVLNISAGGMALRKFPQARGNIRVGELLSFKDNGASHWSVGILCWVSNEHQLEIGAQLIASHQNKFEPVLLLAGVPTLKQPASIIAACGMYSPARMLDLDEGGKISRVMVTKLIKRTSSFEHFQYSHL